MTTADSTGDQLGEPSRKALPPETRVVRSYAGGLHAQREAGEAAVINLKGLDRRLGQLARQELRPNEGSHVYLLRIDAIR